jgi:putative peptidoglycan lipid II flippase
MKRILKRATKKMTLSNAAVLLVATSFTGQLLGFLRVKLVNANFSAFGPQSTDSFFAAFKIPDFFFFTIAAGALGVAFMPILADHLQRKDKKGVWDLSSSLLNFLALIMLVVGLGIFIFARPLISYIVAPNLDPEQLNNAVMIMRLIAFNPLLFTISGILTSVQQTFGRFFFYAMAPLIYNISIIISIFLFRDNIGLVGLGIGALAGAVLQVLTALIGLYGMNFKYRQVIHFKSPDFRKILTLLPPRSIDLGITSINSIVATNYARRLGSGYVSFYENAYTLHTAPTLLIGTAISTAAFPRFNNALARGRKDQFREEFLKVLRIIIWIVTPVVVVCFFGRAYLARMIFSRNAPEIAAIFGFLSGAIFFRTIYTIVSRYFYAQKDTWTPLIDSLLAITLNIFLVMHFAKATSYGVTGIALAESIVAGAQLLVLTVIMLIRDPKLFDKHFFIGLGRIISITGFSVMATYIMVSILPLRINDVGFFTLGIKLGIISLVTFTVHLTLSSLFGLEEAEPVVRKIKAIKRAILRPVPIDV